MKELIALMVVTLGAGVGAGWIAKDLLGKRQVNLDLKFPDIEKVVKDDEQTIRMNEKPEEKEN